MVAITDAESLNILQSNRNELSRRAEGEPKVSRAALNNLRK
jgi:hypothetical protein